MSIIKNNRPVKKMSGRRSATWKRRREILDAALQCFLQNGVAATTIGQIRSASNASHGSIYHLFRSKDEIALTLFVEGMQVYHEKIVQAIRNETTARGVIGAMVTTHLEDTVSDRALSIYLTRMGMAEELGEISDQYRSLNNEFAQEIWSRLEPFVERGEMIRVPRELYFSLIIGPAAHLSRSWLRGRIDFDLLSATDRLADSACQSLQSERNIQK